ncbi:DNA polymerase III subunit delta' C-terminal domain-containing protein [Candidatus Riesia pediculischaeffi]|uniref:DNA polymerase III subunit delta' n=1 Tax=Candidatus Riesia pediculischaeffi PTSU TaxID=1401651 RepID=A0A0C1S0L0_9ENTR|nr:DNA polymerase III subunit delta' C-terminal domain-containing protein [Candidatus Riesia pediculischaeffi]KIE64097.1 DNA polymerase III delta prime subunit [Candidatus Riesia pediculischaeffi PTSU]
MIWYPWLDQDYRRLVALLMKKKRCLSVLLYSNLGVGSELLVRALVRWIMCEKRRDIATCNQCENCKMVSSDIHPDFYKIDVLKKENSIKVEDIRKISEIVQNYTIYNSKRVVWIKEIRLLTKEARYCLIKILEDFSEKNTYFFLECHQILPYLSSLNSKCLHFSLKEPSDETVMKWINENHSFPEINVRIATRSHSGSPLKALNLLKKKNWDSRESFYFKFTKNIIHGNDLVGFLRELRKEDVFEKISLLMILLLDSIKYRKNAVFNCINQDKLDLIRYINKVVSTRTLLSMVESLEKFVRNLNVVSFTNLDLQIIIQTCNLRSCFI